MRHINSPFFKDRRGRSNRISTQQRLRAKSLTATVPGLFHCGIRTIKTGDRRGGGLSVSLEIKIKRIDNEKGKGVDIGYWKRSLWSEES
ncbi:hypothetical protein CDAR_204821 [Caerostris darwini]|uniref:Uncharacterized protein n=1 Tax=Caerostris darwini TaxID=1538125 RepID=A0AAV4PBE1_9ARAC|nr:hypothetical protein CDAR_204821 [Caerostris darwini]